MLAMISVALLRLAVEMRKLGFPSFCQSTMSNASAFHSPEHPIPRRAAYGSPRLFQLQALSTAPTESYVTRMVARHSTRH